MINQVIRPSVMRPREAKMMCVRGEPVSASEPTLGVLGSPTFTTRFWVMFCICIKYPLSCYILYTFKPSITSHRAYD